MLREEMITQSLVLLINPTFAKAFDGYVTAASAIDPETGRYYAMAEIMTSDNPTTNKDGTISCPWRLKVKKDGQNVEVYGDARYCLFRQ